MTAADQPSISTPEERFFELGYPFDDGSMAAPMGSYVSSVRAGNLVFMSGHPPMWSGEIKFRGKVGRDIDLEEGKEAARLAVYNAVASLRREVGNLDQIERIVKLLGFVNCDDDFEQQPTVIDGASDLLREAFGDRGLHARAAVGAPALPANISVEIELIAALKADG